MGKIEKKDKITLIGRKRELTDTETGEKARGWGLNRRDAEETAFKALKKQRNTLCGEYIPPVSSTDSDSSNYSLGGGNSDGYSTNSDAPRSSGSKVGLFMILGVIGWLDYSVLWPLTKAKFESEYRIIPGNVEINYESGRNCEIDRAKYPGFYRRLDLDQDGAITEYELDSQQDTFKKITKRHSECNIESIVIDFMVTTAIR